MKLLDFARQELEVERAEAEQQRLAAIETNGERLLRALEYVFLSAGSAAKEFMSRVVIDTAGLRVPGQQREVAVATLDGLHFVLLNTEYGGRRLEMLFMCPECQQPVTAYITTRASDIAEVVEQWEMNRCGHKCGQQPAAKPKTKICPLIQPTDGIECDCNRDECAWWSDGACAVARLGKACAEYVFASAE